MIHNRIQLNICHTMLALLLCSALLWTGCVTSSGGNTDTTSVTEALAQSDYAPAIVDAADASYSYDDMAQDLLLLQRAFPSRLSVFTAGKSCDGREIYYAMVGNDDAPKTIMIQGGIHGREYLTPQLIMCQMEYYLSRYETEFSSLFAEFRFCVIPMINPDGIMLSQEGISAIRSPELRSGIEAIYLKDVTTSPDLKSYFGDLQGYLKLWKANAEGVDLNRNFGIDGWQEIQSRSYPSLLAYKGSSPNSEPETQALINLTSSMDSLVCSVSYHSQGEIIYWDSGQTGELRNQTLHLAQAASALSGYELQQTFTAPDGTYNDWSMLCRGIPSIILETGVGNCPLPHEQFDTILEQNLLMWKQIAQAINA